MDTAPRASSDGLVWVLIGLIGLAIIASCQWTESPQPFTTEPLPHLPSCPEPVCPEPVCPPQGQQTSTTLAVQPQQGEGTATAKATNPAPTSRIDINTATPQQLAALPGVGPKTAERIVAARQTRPFATTRDLLRVKGIGPAKFARLKDHVMVAADRM